MKLFKFLPPERVDIIEKERIACTPPERFKDPFEVLARFTPAVSKKIWEDTFAEFKATELDPNLKRRQRKKQARLLKEKAKREIDLTEMHARLEQIATGKVRRNLGVICFGSGSAVQENLLWYHCADGHRGFVIELDSEHPDIRKLGNLHKVSYGLPPVYDIAQPPTMDLLTTKPPYLQYEAEYRIFCKLDSCKPETVKGELTIYFRDLPKTCIKALHLGHRMDPSVEKRLLALLAGLPAEIYLHSPSGPAYDLKAKRLR